MNISPCYRCSKTKLKATVDYGRTYNILLGEKLPDTDNGYSISSYTLAPPPIKPDIKVYCDSCGTRRQEFDFKVTITKDNTKFYIGEPTQKKALFLRERTEKEETKNNNKIEDDVSPAHSMWWEGGHGYD